MQYIIAYWADHHQHPQYQEQGNEEEEDKEDKEDKEEDKEDKEEDKEDKEDKEEEKWLRNVKESVSDNLEMIVIYLKEGQHKMLKLKILEVIFEVIRLGDICLN